MQKSREKSAAVIAVLLLGACGGAGEDTTSTDRRPTTTAAAPVVESTTTAPGATAAAEQTGETNVVPPTTTAPTTTTPDGPTTTAVDAAPSVSAARPGTYVYRQSGSSSHGEVPAQGTLVVDAPAAGGAQLWRRAVDPKQPASEVHYAFRADGPFIERVVKRSSGLEFDCTFDEPLPAPPWPGSIGETFGGHADCGRITVDVQGRVVERRTATIDGTAVEVIVVETTTTTAGQVKSTTDEVQWWAPELSLSVHTESRQRGTFAGLAISSDITSDLLSIHPT